MNSNDISSSEIDEVLLQMSLDEQPNTESLKSKNSIGN